MPANTSQPSLKEVLRQKRAEYILEVAETVLLEKGYRDASMDEIAARAGVSMRMRSNLLFCAVVTARAMSSPFTAKSSGPPS